MTAPRFYSWDDDGSPGRALTGNYQNKLKQILVACLVNGFGSKPGAGWALAHEHSNGFTLSNGRGDFFVNFVSDTTNNQNAGSIHVYAANSITDSSGPVIEGANLCSGEYRKGINNVATRHVFYVQHAFITQQSSLQWTVVADDSTFVFNYSTPNSNDDLYKIYYSSTLYAGDIAGSPIDAPIVIGGDVVGFSEAPGTFALCGGYSAPVNPLSGFSSSIVIGAEPYKSDKTREVGNSLLLDVSDLRLQQPRVFAGSMQVGALRGVLYDDVLRAGSGWPSWLKALGLNENNYENRSQRVNILSSNYAFARSYSGNSILTDNPEFW